MGRRQDLIREHQAAFEASSAAFVGADLDSLCQ